MAKSKKESDFKGVWIPAEVWLDTRLGALETIILMEIDSLSCSKRGCYASNAFIAEFCQCSTTTVSKTISKLIEIGYVVKEEHGRQRILKTTFQNSQENLSKNESNLSKIESQPFKNCKAAFQKMQTSNIRDYIIREDIDKTRYDEICAHTREEYRSLIRENIDYEILSEQTDVQMLDEIVELMTDTVCTSGKHIVIASKKQSLSVVKSQFLKLTSEHIEYVIDRILNASDKIRNVKQYILACLFNAPSTMNSYYSTKVSQDMRGGQK